jgi:hypothetical protein
MMDEGMPTYHVSLDLRLPPGLDDAALDGVLRGAINTAACAALEVTPTALLVEADLPSSRRSRPPCARLLKSVVDS